MNPNALTYAVLQYRSSALQSIFLSCCSTVMKHILLNNLIDEELTYVNKLMLLLWA